MSYLLGLTGGIASGKSTVSQHFIDKGIPVIDADLVAREVVEPGTIGLEKIVSTFGEDILLSNGTLDRKKLGDIIFEDSQKRLLLNEVLRLEISMRIKELLEIQKNKQSPLIILDIPLLFEGGYDKLTDETMVVSVSHDTQIKRLMNRNSLSIKEAKMRVNSQMALKEKIKKSDSIIDNEGSIYQTKQQVDEWLKLFFKEH